MVEHQHACDVPCLLYEEMNLILLVLTIFGALVEAKLNNHSKSFNLKELVDGLEVEVYWEVPLERLDAFHFTFEKDDSTLEEAIHSCHSLKTYV